MLWARYGLFKLIDSRHLFYSCDILVKVNQKKFIFLIIALFGLQNCNTVTGTVEGTTRGVVKDAKTLHHYSTCIFTKTQCGDLNLED